MDEKRKEYLLELSFKTACREMMYSSGEIDLEEVIPRAKDIFDKIVETKYFDYFSPFEDDDTVKNTTLPTKGNLGKIETPKTKLEVTEKEDLSKTKTPKNTLKTTKENMKDTKECPWCREQIPTKWTEHKFKTNKVVCGWKEKR